MDIESVIIAAAEPHTIWEESDESIMEIRR